MHICFLFTPGVKNSFHEFHNAVRVYTVGTQENVCDYQCGNAPALVQRIPLYPENKAIHLHNNIVKPSNQSFILMVTITDIPID
jgi:hypothetical protein